MIELGRVEHITLRAEYRATPTHSKQRCTISLAAT